MNSRRKSDKASTRDHNRRLILNCLRQAGELSRVSLIAVTGLAASTVTTVVAELQAEGFLVERDKGPSSGGRRPIFVAIDYAQHQAIGIKLMHDRIDATLTDLATAPIDGMCVPLSDLTPAAVADQVAVLCQRLMQRNGISPDRLVGIGLALPGFIDAELGVCLESARMGWSDVPIARLVSDKTQHPVWIDNDVNAYAIAQQLFGMAKSRQSLLAVVFGTGLGAALITSGGLHRGGRFKAGEIGFIRDDPGSAPSGDDNRSWGRQFAEPELLRLWSDLAPEHGLAGMDLADAAMRGLAPATDLLGKIGRAFGWRLAGMIGMFDPEAIILGGEAMRFGTPLIGPMIESYYEAAGHDAPQIQIDSKNDIWTRGAAALAIQSFFAAPGS